MSIELLISVVRRGRGDHVVSLAKSSGASGSTVLLGRGTARNSLLRLLFLADTEKEVIFTLGSETEMKEIIATLRNAPDLCQKVPGIGFVVDVSSFFHSGAELSTPNMGDTALQTTGTSMNTSHQLICVIVNAGFADDIMSAARDAGAPGGTVIRARGTGTEKDSSFFGITIVPEKELLMMLVKTDCYGRILDAVRNCPCLSQPGIGIVFALPVNDFFPLGKH